jgi:prepilin-type N-terminal cleavage/methylation domain-containing protein
MSFEVRYDCQRCTACCRWPGWVRVDADEIAAMARLLGQEEGSFIQEYTQLRPQRDGLALVNRANGECVFLEGRDCRVQGAKPRQCQGFPNTWNFPGWREVCEARPSLVVRDSRRESGFTLLEISMAVVIGLMMLSLALPSVSGVFSEQRLRERMGEFEGMALKAASMARKSNREVRLRLVKVGKDGGVGWWMGAMEGEQEVEDGVSGVVLELDREEKVQLNRLAARKGVVAPMEWSFWPNGTREPVELSYEGPGGKWVLRFGALVPDPDVVLMRPK